MPNQAYARIKEKNLSGCTMQSSKSTFESYKGYHFQRAGARREDGKENKKRSTV